MKEVGFLQVIKICRRPYQTKIIQLVHSGVSRYDIHGFPAEEMQKAAFYLCRAPFDVRAEPLGLIVFLDQSSAAVRAYGREVRFLCVLASLGEFHSRDFRDDFAALLDIDKVSYADVHLCHHISIVQCCPFDHCSRQLDRVKIRHRSYSSGPSNLIINGFDLCQCLFGLEFVCHCPAWKFGRIAKFRLICQFIDFYDNAVGGIWKEFALLVPIVDVFFYFIDIVTYFALV